MKLYKMIEIYLKYDNMHIFGMINAFICINNHVISCISSMLLTKSFVRSLKHTNIGQIKFIKLNSQRSSKV